MMAVYKKTREKKKKKKFYTCKRFFVSTRGCFLFGTYGYKPLKNESINRLNPIILNNLKHFLMS